MMMSIIFFHLELILLVNCVSVRLGQYEFYDGRGGIMEERLRTSMIVLP